MRFLLFFVIATVGCGDSAEWRPARGVREYDQRVERAQRSEDELECTFLGVVHAEGDDIFRDIGETAARHGATHYVLQDDHTTVTGYQTRTVISQPTDNLSFVNSRTTATEERRAWAKAYRCWR